MLFGQGVGRPKVLSGVFLLRFDARQKICGKGELRVLEGDRSAVGGRHLQEFELNTLGGVTRDGCPHPSIAEAKFKISAAADIKNEAHALDEVEVARLALTTTHRVRRTRLIANVWRAGRLKRRVRVGG